MKITEFFNKAFLQKKSVYQLSNQNFLSNWNFPWNQYLQKKIREINCQFEVNCQIKIFREIKISIKSTFSVKLKFLSNHSFWRKSIFSVKSNFLSNYTQVGESKYCGKMLLNCWLHDFFQNFQWNWNFPWNWNSLSNQSFLPNHNYLRKILWK